MLIAKCEFCGAEIAVGDESLMMYDISIFPSEGYSAETAGEEVPILEVTDGACIKCAKRVKDLVLSITVGKR